MAVFQLAGRIEETHHSIFSLSTLRGSSFSAAGFRQSYKGRCIIVEIDEGAAAPELGADRDEVDIGFFQIGFIEDMFAEDEGVDAVHVPAPAMEGADNAFGFAIAVTAWRAARRDAGRRSGMP